MRKSPESKKEITRDEVIKTYSKFIKQGITNPDDLDLEDDQVKQANELFYKWGEQESTSGLAKTMFYVDAGFTNPMYLERIRSILRQDKYKAEEKKNGPEGVETYRQIIEAIERINHLLGE